MVAVDAFGRARSAFFARQPQERWRGSYSSRRRQPQCRRGSADVLTINRPDARIKKSLATKKQKKAKQPGLVSVTEKTKRLSGVSHGHAGPHGKRDADPDRRSHDRGGDFAVHADHGCRHEDRRDRDSKRGEHLAVRPSHRKRLQVPGRGTRQGCLRARGRNREYWRAGQALSAGKFSTA